MSAADRPSPAGRGKTAGTPGATPEAVPLPHLDAAVKKELLDRAVDIRCHRRLLRHMAGAFGGASALLALASLLLPWLFSFSLALVSFLFGITAATAAAGVLFSLSLYLYLRYLLRLPYAFYEVTLTRALPARHGARAFVFSLREGGVRFDRKTEPLYRTSPRAAVRYADYAGARVLVAYSGETGIAMVLCRAEDASFLSL